MQERHLCCPPPHWLNSTIATGYTMYCHVFWCGFGKISIAAVALSQLLPNALRTAWRGGTIENWLYDATYDFIPLNSVI